MTDRRKTIFLIDGNPVDIAAIREMLQDSFKVVSLLYAVEMFDLMDDITPDIILLDVELPDMSGYEAIRRLKKTKRWALIPVIFITAVPDPCKEVAGLELGAVDYIRKPVVASTMRKRIETRLLQDECQKALKKTNDILFADLLKKSQEVVKLQQIIVKTIASMVECRDDNTGGHVARVQRYLELLTSEMIKTDTYSGEMLKWDLDFAIQGALLHDVGKIGIPDTILNKPAKLTNAEFEIMKTHVQIGVDAITGISVQVDPVSEHAFLHHAKLFAGAHHEHWDGTGYPSRLSGLNIPLEGRLLAIADVYDALTSKRPYKDAFDTKVATEMILTETGKHFDPKLVRVFCRVYDAFAEIAKAQ